MLKFEYMEDAVIPYQLPEPENHSFFFIDQRVDTQLEAKLHLPPCITIGITALHRLTKQDVSII